MLRPRLTPVLHEGSRPRDRQKPRWPSGRQG